MGLEQVIVAGTASRRLATDLADILRAATANTDIKRFPDGEVYTRIEDDVEGKHTILVQTTHPNDNLVEMLLLQDAAQEAGAARVTSVIPYYGYARQDRVFQPGEAVSSRAVARALATTTDQVITVDPHKEAILDFFCQGARSVSAVAQIAKRLEEWGVDCILAPDAGARKRAEAAGAILGLPVDHLEKVRLSATKVDVKAKRLDVDGKRVAMLDDMIASGGTMRSAAGHLKRQGATRVYAACTHGLFTGGAVPKMREAGIDRVLCTDTVEGDDAEVVSAAPAVAEALLATLTT